MHRGAPSCAKRRWFLAEHFYSSIDKPWFAHTGFPEYLKHCGLDHIEKFTRADWRLIHRSLGKPRRLSLPFLRRERLDLERYRATVREKHHQMTLDAIQAAPPPPVVGPPVQRLITATAAAAAAIMDTDSGEAAAATAVQEREETGKAAHGGGGVRGAHYGAVDDDRYGDRDRTTMEDDGTGDMMDDERDAMDGYHYHEHYHDAREGCGPHDDATPPPLCVGDRVVARHPRVINVHAGSILTVQGKRCRVQFDRHELGCELVRDISIAHLPASEEEEEEEDALGDRDGDGTAHAAAGDWSAPSLSGRADEGSALHTAATTALTHHTQQWAVMQRLATANVGRAGGLGALSSTATNAAATAAATAAAVAAAAEAAAAAAVSGDDPSVDASGSGGLRTALGFDEAAPETAAAIAAAAAAARASLALSTNTVTAAAHTAAAHTAAAHTAAAHTAAAQLREDAMRALAEVSIALNLKETLVAELRYMNDYADNHGGCGVRGDGAKQEGGGEGGNDRRREVATPASSPPATPATASTPSLLEPFQRQYASTMLRIRECNQQLQAALVRLREQHRRHEVKP
jgi:hypothetical protein